MLHALALPQNARVKDYRYYRLQNEVEVCRNLDRRHFEQRSRAVRIDGGLSIRVEERRDLVLRHQGNVQHHGVVGANHERMRILEGGLLAEQVMTIQDHAVGQKTSLDASQLARIGLAT